MMRRIVGAALAAASFLALRLGDRLADERNIRRLAEHEGCSYRDARRLYRLARREGYGAAHGQVFGGRSLPGGGPSGPDLAAKRADEAPG